MAKFDLDTVKLSELLADPDARKVIDEVVPGMADNPMVQMAAQMTASQVLSMAGGQIGADKVAALKEKLTAL